ncbi:MAG: hypothetical protein IPL40_07225 [Proteobacteria bacterium]|nr:hypothetical protein [Pseudomonadota bacterium]
MLEMLWSSRLRFFAPRHSTIVAASRARRPRLRAIVTLGLVVVTVAADPLGGRALADARGGLQLRDRALEHILHGDIIRAHQAVPVHFRPGPGKPAAWSLLRRNVRVIDGGLHTQEGWARFLALRAGEGAPLLSVVEALELPLAQLLFVSETREGGRRAATIPVFESYVDERTGVGFLTLPRAALSADALRRAQQAGERSDAPLHFARKALLPEGLTEDPEHFARLLAGAYRRGAQKPSGTPLIELREAMVSAPLPQGGTGEPFPLRIATKSGGELISAYPYFDRTQLFVAVPEPTAVNLLSALQHMKVLGQRSTLRGLPAALQHLPDALQRRLEHAAAQLVRAELVANLALPSPLTATGVASVWQDRRHSGEGRKARAAARRALNPLFEAAALGLSAEPWRLAVASCARALPLELNGQAAIKPLTQLMMLADLAVDQTWGSIAAAPARQRAASR